MSLIMDSNEQTARLLHQQAELLTSLADSRSVDKRHHVRDVRSENTEK